MPPPRRRLDDELAAVHDHWFPRVVARVNDQYFKVAKLHGEFVWHSHADEDELFLVLNGRLRIHFEDGEVALDEGELCVVPKGTRHKPVADEECWIALIEPVQTRQAGDAETPLTRSIEEQLGA